MNFYLFEMGRAVQMPDHSLRSLPANPLKDEQFIAVIAKLFGKCAQQSRFLLRSKEYRYYPTHKTAGELGQSSKQHRFTKAVLTVLDESLQLTNEKPAQI